MKRTKFAPSIFVDSYTNEIDGEDFVETWIRENSATLPTEKIPFDAIKHEVREDFKQKEK